MFQENCEQPLKHCHYGLSLFGHCMTERSVIKVLKAFGKHFKQLIFPNHVYPSKLLDMANHCKNETQLTLPAVTKLDLRKLNQAVQHMRDLKRLEVQLTLLEISLFTRVVYPQYMEQLIVCYFSSFSVNSHSLMLY